MPAFAGVGRQPGADQGRPRGSPLRRWRIPANADGTACGAFFELTRLRYGFGAQAVRAGRIASPGRPAFGVVTRGVPRGRLSRSPASAETCQWLGAMRAARWACAPKPVARRRVGFEKRPAGVPIGGGASLVPSACATSLSKRSPPGLRTTRAGAAIVRHAPEGRFSGRRPRRRATDRSPPNR
jgi:hypothetical protein